MPFFGTGALPSAVGGGIHARIEGERRLNLAIDVESPDSGDIGRMEMWTKGGIADSKSTTRTRMESARLTDDSVYVGPPFV